jgi:hypothetical protein
MVEIFKTNVTHTADASQLMQQLLGRHPESRISFDLEDCDRVLRIEGNEVCATGIIELMSEAGYLCEVLE